MIHNTPRNSFLIAALAAAVVLAAGACTQQAPTPEHQTNTAPSREDVAIEARVEPVRADDVERMMEAAKGTVTVVNFWATWCVPCVVEMPEFAEFYREHDRSDTTFIALSLDAPDELESKVKPFMSTHKLPFPAYVLTERDVEAISRVVRVEISGALPTTIVYDREGNVNKVWEGAITLDELNAVVKPLL